MSMRPTAIATKSMSIITRATNITTITKRVA